MKDEESDAAVILDDFILDGKECKTAVLEINTSGCRSTFSCRDTKRMVLHEERLKSDPTMVKNTD